MQINIRNVKNQKKDISEEIVVSLKLLFFVVSLEKFNLSAVVLGKGDWKMSRQLDLPESMDWRMIRRFEAEQTKIWRGRYWNIMKCHCKTVESISRNRTCSTLPGFVLVLSQQRMTQILLLRSGKIDE
ncbi:hypothetical protein TNCV_3159231 [Trichonephila clavipes]|nr:hypothetical protein TNCV_3159231 [Trichonephila clavipes]